MSRTLLFSVLFPLLALAQQSTPTDTPRAGYNGGDDNPPDPSDAGASGSQKDAFNLSKGALAAIIVVAVIVVIGGIGSATLWWLAKKRQWDIRQSIRRASRRITGRGNTDNNKQSRRRTGIRLNSPPPGKGSNLRHEHDVEKGLPLSSKAPKITTTISSTKQ
ncbi:hypothetical protein CC86DRAFT_325389 [Ophiobolus disseminans]|uniref:Mid2 domain-containing protein n=1 Tax=Ophiobolus disseminans TaxID=1469910 RepID=A0A6A6ZWE9_9PLEO|nr:hypothetical protein CC86DRAFT_325389 [Ophiobolus disseminans]